MSDSSLVRLKGSPGLIEISRVTTQSLVLPPIGLPFSSLVSPSLLTNSTSMPATSPWVSFSVTSPSGLTRSGPETRAKE